MDILTRRYFFSQTHFVSWVLLSAQEDESIKKYIGIPKPNFLVFSQKVYFEFEKFFVATRELIN